MIINLFQASLEPVRLLFSPDTESVISASDESLESLVTSNGSSMLVTIESDDEALGDSMLEETV